MEVTKSDQSKTKLRVKPSCSSKLSSKFLEKESLNGFSLSFSNLPSSLCDFIPNDTETLSHDIDFDIAKNLKKLEKKDPLTKQKSLNDLLEMFNVKDYSSVVSTLKFWPKLYNKLSLDDDKKVRELTQQLMGRYAEICGKEISSIIKQLLPTWIISQSDLHLAAANIAKQSFLETFPNKLKQEKAYLLCWRNIYEIITANFYRTPPQIKDENVGYSKLEEAYIQDIVVNVRTIITLLPYLKNNEESQNDLLILLKSKSFWCHFKQNVNLIQSIYIQFGTELLDHLPELVKNTTLISTNVCECFRMIENYHAHLISRIWNSIVKCCDRLQDQVWKLVSFKSAFLPKFIKLLECGADGNISHIYSCMLPLLTHFPIDTNKVESNTMYEQVFKAMISSCNCPRIFNNETESNCTMKMILECSAYVMIVAHKNNNSVLTEKLFCIVLQLVENFVTDIRYKKTTKFVFEFTNSFVRPLLTKDTVKDSQFINVIVNWVEKHGDNSLFCENLTLLLIEINKMTTSNNDKLIDFQKSLLHCMKIVLKNKLIEHHNQCLIPYFYVCTSYNDMKCQSISTNDDNNILMQCSSLMRLLSPSLINIISGGIASLLLSSDDCNDIVTQYNLFLSSLSPIQSKLFFTKFYPQIMNGNYNKQKLTCIANASISLWQQLINKFFNQIEEYDSDNLTWVTLLDVCGQVSIHGTEDIRILMQSISREVDNYMDKYISIDMINQLIITISQCIESQLMDNIHIIPNSMIINFVKLIVCNSTSLSSDISNDNFNGCMELIIKYLQSCKNNDTKMVVAKQLIDDSISITPTNELSVVSNVIKSIINNVDNEAFLVLINHINNILLHDLLTIENAMNSQINYSTIMVHSQHHVIASIIQKINILHPLTLYPSFNSSLTETINCVCILINSVLVESFSNGHNSNNLLNQCEDVHKLIDKLNMEYYQDILLKCTININNNSNSSIFDQCPTLVLHCLQDIIPTNYSQWTTDIHQAIDRLIYNWSDNELTDNQFILITRVLIPCAIKARYLVQELIIATIISYLSEPSFLTMSNINRVLNVITCLTITDSSYFQVCYPIFMGIKSKFDMYIDQLHAAYIDQSYLKTNKNEVVFDLTSLLKFIAVGVDCSLLNQQQWEFVFCLIDTLIKSDQFSNSINYRSNPIVDNKDHLLNSFWLFKIVSAATVSLASVTFDSIIDEWDNFFSESIFTAILDQFSLVSGDHTFGKLVHSDLFTFYLEALSDSVSLCPVNIIINYTFANGKININDPIDLPKQFLLVFNSLLESMSNYSLSVQLAAYNCLVNLSDKLSHLLLEQINLSEKNESLDFFSINLPCKLLDYMTTDNLDQLDIDKIDDQIILTRCFLSWNIVLHLFSVAQPKLRAEISSFISKNDRCFDKFLNFSFTFMPKNPIVNKKHLSFITEDNNSLNLISDEPQIFTQCIEKRSKFIIYHLSAYIFRRSMQVLPNLCRGWWKSLESNSQSLVDSYVRQFLTKELFKIEFKQLKEIVNKELDDKIEIKVVAMIGEVTVKYNVTCDQSLEQLIKLPNNYPIGNIHAEYKKEMSTKIPHWKNWIKQMTMTLENQNGSIFDGINLWKRNLDNYFNGIEECMICYSILHPSKFTLPSMPCYQCKKKFHKDCMFKWFHSSTNPTCPNCRNVFYDGSQKSNK